MRMCLKKTRYNMIDTHLNHILCFSLTLSDWNGDVFKFNSRILNIMLEILSINLQRQDGFLEGVSVLTYEYCMEFNTFTHIFWVFRKWLAVQLIFSITVTWHINIYYGLLNCCNKSGTLAKTKFNLQFFLKSNPLLKICNYWKNYRYRTQPDTL